MSTENKMNFRGGIAALSAIALVAVFLVWRGGRDGGTSITSYQTPSVQVVGQAETGQSLAAQAESHFAARRYPEAIQAYRRMLAAHPDDAGLYNELGLALHYSGKSEEAVTALEKATSLDPKLQRAWLTYGFVLKSMGRQAQAQAALERTIRLGPATPQGIEAKGMLTP